MSFVLTKVNYSELNGKQKENFNFQKASRACPRTSASYLNLIV